MRVRIGRVAGGRVVRLLRLIEEIVPLSKVARGRDEASRRVLGWVVRVLLVIIEMVPRP